MRHSKPIALDRNDIHVLLDLIGGYGVAVAVGILATLSVCAAYFIYRSVGQRGRACENNGSETTAAKEDGRERGDQPTETESTGEHQEAKTCCSESESREEKNLLAPDNILLPTDVSEKDLNESTLRDLEEITDELLTELEPESEDKTDSDLDQCMEMDPDKPDDKLESEDHSEHVRECVEGRECVEDICEALADVNVQLTRLEGTDEPVTGETEEHLKDHDKSETGLSLERDEPSETESAQEMIYKRHQDVIACTTLDDLDGHVFTAQSKYISDQAVDLSTHNKIKFEVDHKTLTVEENTKTKFEDHHDWRFPRTKDPDCCCNDKKTDMEENIKCRPWFHCGRPDVETLIKHHNNRFDNPLQNYLGFQTDSSFIGGSSTMVSFSGERKSDEDGLATEKKQERKNEISIMDAIMDNNEWLNVGGQEFRDLPWLTQTATSISSVDEKHATEGKEEDVVTLKESLAKDEALANKRVATVQPLPQQVHVTFRIHYITHSSSQLVAVTGSLQELGAWESFVPLHGAKDGFWANTVTLPMESQVEWKFVLVEDGKICRWEECGNRYLVFSGQDEELYLNKCWGCI